jgi:putative cardiolipin synthase
MVAMLALSGACATIDFDAPKSESHAFTDTGDTLLGQRARAFDLGAPDTSGFKMVIDGVDALGARMRLALRAERSIDMQYYLIHGDVAGAMLVDELLQAADRGVRVRILVDDVLTKGQDRSLAAVDAHPEIEVRVFNPFTNRLFRSLNFVTSFNRVNRRMHNKVFIADNQVAIVGGRNIGDEYFAAREDFNFGDLDAVALGPVVPELSHMFDLYWNHRLAVPVDQAIGPPRDPEAALAAGRQRLDERMGELEESRYGHLVEDYAEYRYIDPEEFSWVPYDLVYDSPDKAGTKPNPEAASIVVPLREAVMAADRELIVLSPYFVPTERTLAGARVLRERGVDIYVITNSLAANNHTAVHAGYAPWRKKMLEIGVQLFEVRPDAQATGVDRSGMAESGGTLHTKAFIVDREVFFLGSFNWDPRSAYINTEMGIILQAPEFGEEAYRRMEAALDTNTYRLVLDDDGDLQWVTYDDGKRVVYTKEPETSWWRRFVAGFIGIFPIDAQL